MNYYDLFKIATPIVAAFIAALLGSFFGAFFKEWVSGWFNKTKKQTEIRTSLVKSIVLYFGEIKRLIDLKNNYEVHQTLIRKIRAFKEATTLTEDQRDVLIEEINNVSKVVDNVVKVGGDVYSRTIEIESNILSLSLEASRYFTVHQYRQLKKTVKEIRAYSESDKILLSAYKELQLAELNIYRRDQYFHDMRKLLRVTDDLGQHFEEKVSEILQ